MSTELEKAGGANVVSFTALRDRLTRGQKELIKLLTLHVEKGQPITRDDIKRLYVKVQYPTGRKRESQSFYNYEEKKWEYRWVDRDVFESHTVNIACMQWFKNNLSSCIIKGRIIAIPIIEIEEDVQTIQLPR